MKAHPFQADLENRTCYLESSADKNVAMYKARGFVFKRTVYLNYAELPIPLDIMIREPAPPALPVDGDGSFGRSKGGNKGFSMAVGADGDKTEAVHGGPKAWRGA